MILRNVGLLLALFAAPLLATPTVAHGQGSDQLAMPSPSQIGLSSAGTATSPLQRPVTLDVTNMELGRILAEISSQAALGLVYETGLVPANRRLTVRLDSTAAGAALRKVLQGTDLDFSAVGDRQVVIFRRKAVSSPAAPRVTQRTGTITGRVTEVGSETPVVGAQVLVDGVGRAITNPEGRYRVTNVAPGKHTVSVVSIGYRGGEREVEVGDGATVVVDFALEAAPTQLAEVVVTASGEQRRIELGHDITVLNVDSIVATTPISSVTDLLEGRVPGLIVQRTSGAPGDPARIRLRGVSSPLKSNDPIIVVDGIRVYSEQSDRRGENLATGGTGNYAAPSPLDYIDPNSIETIQVVKGPSAATLYGQDAANGLIIITTKKGRPGPARWTASVEHGQTQMAGKYPDLYMRWGHTYSEANPVYCPANNRVNGFTGTALCMGEEIVRFQMLNDPELTVLDRGGGTAVSVGVSGGSSSLTYNVTGSYRDEVGLIKLPAYEVERFREEREFAPPEWMRRPQNLKQWGASSSLQARLSPKADVTLMASLSRTEQQRSSLERQLGTLMSTYLDEATGTYYRMAGATNVLATDDVLNDYYERATATATRFMNGASLNWRPLPWLSFAADAGLDVVQRSDDVFLPGKIVSTAAQGRLSRGKGTSIVSTVNLRANTQVPLGLGFGLRLAAGVNYSGMSIDDIRSSASGLPEGTESLNGATNISLSESRLDQSTIGWYIEPSINHRRFWLSTGLRLDGASSFGTRVKLPSFPKLSISHLISDEPFFPEALKSVFNTLRLRAAYGHAGRQPGITDRLRLYGAPSSNWIDGRIVNSVDLSTLGNVNLKPERSREIEGGFDATLLDDRLSIGVTGYRKTTEDALLNMPVAPSVYGRGVSILENVGTIRNAGFELTLGIEPVRSERVTWQSQLHLSRNRNIVVELGPGVEPFYTSSTTSGGQVVSGVRVAPGFPLFGRWNKPILGYADANGNGRLEPHEVILGDTAVYVGGTLPEYSASLHSTVSLFRGALSVSASLQFEDGMSQRNQVASQLAPFSRGWNDPSATFAEQLAVADPSGYTWNQTVNTLRLQSMSVRYHVPTRIAQRLGANSLNISLQGTNLGLWTNYSGVDPNVNARPFGNDLIDTGVLPMPRTWQIRVSTTF